MPLALVSCEYPLVVFPVKARSVPLPSATLLRMETLTYHMHGPLR